MEDSKNRSGLGSYLECMSRALLTGLASFGLAVSATYFPQILLQAKLPYPKKAFMPISFAVGGAVAYAVTSKRTKVCQGIRKASKNSQDYLSSAQPEVSPATKD